MLTSLEAAGMWELSWDKITSLESLRVYLLLPSFYFFSSPSYQSVKTLHLPFVRAIQLLRESNRKILGRFKCFLPSEVELAHMDVFQKYNEYSGLLPG